MEDKKTFGDFIAKKRKEVNLTQKDLASKLFVTESAVSKWERGISYPDITLIKNICDLLEISEHELISASTDLKKNQDVLFARKYQRIVKIYSYTWYLLYGISLLVCFIVNLAVNKTLSWFFIVLASELLAFSLTSLPLLVKKHKSLVTLGSFFVSLNILLLICNIYSQGNWFFITFVSLLFGFTVVFFPIIIYHIDLKAIAMKYKFPEQISNHKTLITFIVDSILLLVLVATANIYSDGHWFFRIGLPITFYWLLYPWLLMVVIRYLKVNGFFKTSIVLFISAFYSFFTEGITNSILEGKPFVFRRLVDFSNWSNEYLNGNIAILTVLALGLCGIIFCIGGIIRQIQAKH